MYIYFDLYLSIHILMRLGPNSRRFHPQTSSKLHRLSHLLSIGDFTFGSRASSPKSKDKPPEFRLCCADGIVPEAARVLSLMGAPAVMDCWDTLR